MIIPWQNMGAEEFARFRSSVGEGVVLVGGVYWRQIRPFFYRPLLPYTEYPPAAVKRPALAVLGGIQHAVPPGVEANSCLNLLLFDDPSSYSLHKLKGNDRREVTRAADYFKVSLITDVQQFKTQAYPVYLSFYDRTKYGYKSERRHAGRFSQWADALFRNPKVMVLGAYKANHELGAVSVGLLVEGTLIYAMFFSETESLKKHVAGFMLHTIRESAANSSIIKQIFAGNYKYSAARGVDDFYLARGCKLVRKPAWLHLNLLTKTGLKRFAPGQYTRLVGAIPEMTKGPATESARPALKPASGAAAVESNSNP